MQSETRYHQPDDRFLHHSFGAALGGCYRGINCSSHSPTVNGLALGDPTASKALVVGDDHLEYQLGDRDYGIEPPKNDLPITPRLAVLRFERDAWPTAE